ncbi:MAG: hypothetical protein IPL61_28025 [Myxococcales bacterium]|nr:hypothetical protein [Myxococcales bacterium]MBK9035068.1 hypothetical protein [Myxococcales bacterium]
MRALGLEPSCDEAAAVVAAGPRALSDVGASPHDGHGPDGNVDTRAAADRVAAPVRALLRTA